MPENDIDIQLRVDASEVDDLTQKFQKAEKNVRQNFQGIRRDSDRVLKGIARQGSEIEKKLFRQFPGAASATKQIENITKRNNAAIAQAARQYDRAFKSAGQYQVVLGRTVKSARAVDKVLRTNTGSLKAFESQARRSGKVNPFQSARALDAHLKGLRTTTKRTFDLIERGSQRLGTTLPQPLRKVTREGIKSAEELRRSWAKAYERINASARRSAGAGASGRIRVPSPRDLLNQQALDRISFGPPRTRTRDFTSSLSGPQSLNRLFRTQQVMEGIRRNTKQATEEVQVLSQRLGNTLPQALGKVERRNAEAFKKIRRDFSHSVEFMERRARRLEKLELGRRLITGGPTSRRIGQLESRVLGGARNLASRVGSSVLDSTLGPNFGRQAALVGRNITLMERWRRVVRRLRVSVGRFGQRFASTMMFIRREARKAQQIVGGFGRVFGVLRSRLLGITGLLAGIGATFAARKFLGAIVSFGERAEISIVQLQTLFRTSREQAKGFFQTIREFARPLPVTTESVVNSFIRLKSVGVDPTAKAIQGLINASIALARPLENIVLGVQSLETESLRKLGINLNRRGERAILSFGVERIELPKDDTKIRQALLDLFNRAFAGALEGSLKNFTVAKDVLRSVLGDFFVPAGLNLLNKSLTRTVGLVTAWLSLNEDLVTSRLGNFIDSLSSSTNDMFTPENIDTFLNQITLFIENDLSSLVSLIGDLFNFTLTQAKRLIDFLRNEEDFVKNFGKDAFVGIGIGIGLNALGVPAPAAFAAGIGGSVAIGNLTRRATNYFTPGIGPFFASAEGGFGRREVARAVNAVPDAQAVSPFTTAGGVFRRKTPEELQAEKELVESKKRESQVAREVITSIKGLEREFKKLNASIASNTPAFDNTTKLLSRFNEGTIGTLGAQSVQSEVNKTVTGVIASVTQLETIGDLSFLPRQKVTQAEELLENYLRITRRDVSTLREEVFGQILDRRDAIAKEREAILEFQGERGISTGFVINTITETALGEFVEEIQAGRVTAQNQDRVINQLLVKNTKVFDDLVKARGITPEQLAKAFLNFLEIANIESLFALGTKDRLTPTPKAIEALEATRADELVRSISETFKEGINKGINLLFLRSGGGLERGVETIADTAFSGFTGSVSNLLSKRVNTSLEKSFEGIGKTLAGPLQTTFGSFSKQTQERIETAGSIASSGLLALGAARQGNRFGAAAGGASAGSVVGGVIGTAIAGPAGTVPGKIAGAVVGGVLGAIFGGGDKAAGVKFDLLRDINLEDVRRAADDVTFRREISSFVQDRLKVPTGQFQELYRQIFKTMEDQVEEVANIFRALPVDLFSLFNEAITLEGGGTPRFGQDRADGLDFGTNNKERQIVSARLQDFIAGIGGSVIADLIPNLSPIFDGLSERLDSAKGFLDRELQEISLLEGTARTARGREFLETTKAMVEAFNLLEGNVGIRGSVERFRTLLFDFNLGSSTTISSLNTALSSTVDLDPQVLARWKEARELLLQIPQRFNQLLSATVGQISAFSDFRETDFDGLIGTLTGGNAGIRSLLGQEGLSIEERQQLLGAEHSNLQQIIALERQKFDAEIQTLEKSKSLLESMLQLAESIENTLLGLRTGSDSPFSPAQQTAALLRQQGVLQGRLTEAGGLRGENVSEEAIRIAGQLRDLFPQFPSVGQGFGQGSAAQRALFRFAESGLTDLLGDFNFKTQNENLSDINAKMDREFQVSEATKLLLETHLADQNDLLTDILEEMKKFNEGGSGRGSGRPGLDPSRSPNPLSPEDVLFDLVASRR